MDLIEMSNVGNGGVKKKRWTTRTNSIKVVKILQDEYHCL